nr:unnamed protein product [Digitaria exilis]
MWRLRNCTPRAGLRFLWVPCSSPPPGLRAARLPLSSAAYEPWRGLLVKTQETHASAGRPGRFVPSG